MRSVGNQKSLLPKKKKIVAPPKTKGGGKGKTPRSVRAFRGNRKETLLGGQKGMQKIPGASEVLIFGRKKGRMVIIFARESLISRWKKQAGLSLTPPTGRKKKACTLYKGRRR